MNNRAVFMRFLFWKLKTKIRMAHQQRSCEFDPRDTIFPTAKRLRPSASGCSAAANWGRRTKPKRGCVCRVERKPVEVEEVKLLPSLRRGIFKLLPIKNSGKTDV